MKSKNFAITGVAGYIAPRHLKAIKDVNGNLLASLDPFDSVGIIDSYFPNSNFFREIEQFDKYLSDIQRFENKKLDYLSICSPNHLHDSHMRLAMRQSADAICEKPLVLEPNHLDVLQKLELETGQRIWTVLQLRVHKSLLELKSKIDLSTVKKRHKIRLTYVTSRGNWYHESWKGDLQKSGGIASNIGIHFFDMLIWIFGKVDFSEIHLSKDNKMGGFIELENADVEWFLSLDPKDIPFNDSLLQRTFRSIKVDDEDFEFSGGFTELHSTIYNETLSGRGFGIEQARPAIEIVEKIRNSKVSNNNKGSVHPIIKSKYS
jgi:UDP-N-acetyl-2-amino-2-deoxyglucuronate dehydrogenase